VSRKGRSRLRARGAILILAVLLLARETGAVPGDAAPRAAGSSQEESQPSPAPPPQESPEAVPAPQTEEASPPAAPAPESQPATEKPAPPRKPHPKKRETPETRLDDLQRKIAALAPRGTYILIDTGVNHLYLMRDRSVEREAICSTGSGRFLPDPPRNREWTFDTPKGEFRIQKKIVKPVWIKPDWAFIEDGEDLPKDSGERVAPDELGDYAMDLGDGYLIHGTLYERSLGMSVTHGCIRLGAKDLDVIFHAVKVGTPVFIF
jgi:lipoprotein-anchoring transpeptidase ErfK/SrfK